MRVVQYQKNPWAAAANLAAGLDPQRSDLWIVDFRPVINGLSDTLDQEQQPVPAYFVQSVALPELRVKSDVFRRDSRPYQMPSWDDPPDAVRMSFILDTRDASAEQSHIYRLLDNWRRVVRAGRRSMGTENEIQLNARYRIDYRFNIYVILLSGANVSSPVVSSASVSSPLIIPSYPIGQTQQAGESRETFLQRVAKALNLQREATAAAVPRTQTKSPPWAVDVDLQYSGFYILEKTWLGGFKLGDLNYTHSGLMSLEATFYSENILDNASVL